MTKFVNNSLFGKNKAIKIAKRLSDIFLLTFKFAAHASFPWKLSRYSYGVQFGINCTALDQSKLSNFVECTVTEGRGWEHQQLLLFGGIEHPLFKAVPTIVTAHLQILGFPIANAY